MTKEILNRVEKSGIVTIDFDEFQTPKILVIDIKDWLNDGLYLIEKDFRKRIEKHNLCSPNRPGPSHRFSRPT